jgi:hypothetical protein
VAGPLLSSQGIRQLLDLLKRRFTFHQAGARGGGDRVPTTAGCAAGVRATLSSCREQ